MRRSLGCTGHALNGGGSKGKARTIYSMVSTKVGLPAIARANARLFILGSLPGDASLSARRYYAHPTNQFWRLLGEAIGEDLQPMSYDDRLRRLAERSIGLWDVIASASRPGSLDQAIRAAEHNPVEQLRHDFPELRALAFNGSTAATAGRKLLGPVAGLEVVELPSSSAANTRAFTEKAQAWAAIAKFIG